VETACSRQALVVAITSWEVIGDLALMPFLLHTCWADRARELGLNATFALFPFPPTAQRLTMEPLIDPELAVLARYVARFDRNDQERSKPVDFVHPDWEEGYQRHKSDLQPDQILPARAFLAVDQVRPDGSVDSGHRPVLGRFAMRGTRHVAALRPMVLVAPRSLTPAAMATLVKVDLLIADVQGLRGPRGLDQLRQLLTARGRQRPTVLVASSPSDLVALQLDGTLGPMHQMVIGQVPTVPKAQVREVERQRPQTEESFRFAVLDLKGTDVLIDRVIPLAVSAWWSAHQRLAGPLTADPAYRRLAVALEDLRRMSPDSASALDPLTAMLQNVAADESRVESRLSALIAAVDEHLNQSRARSVTVLLRDCESASFLTEQIAKTWGVGIDELAALGVTIATPHAMAVGETEALVVNGYYGASTTDDLIRSGARFATLVFDPLESQAFHRGLEAMQRVLTDNVALGHLLSNLIEVVEPHLPPHAAGAVEVGLGLYGTPVSDPGGVLPVPGVEFDGKITIYFTDGTFEMAASNHRFDVLAPMGANVTSVAANELQPGNEVILTSSGQFSARLLEALDDGLLLEHAEKRQAWLKLANAVVSANRLPIPTLQARLRHEGVLVDNQTIRGWVRGPDLSHTVPDRWPHFKALAGAIGLELPESVLQDFYTSVRILRIRHRQAGRDLVRAMRAAAASRLTAASLRRIESTWGLTVRELVSATRLAVVDEVNL
jgi:hypothetical protein